MTNDELIQEHTELFHTWMRKAFPSQGGYNGAATRQYSARILYLEGEADRRGINQQLRKALTNEHQTD
jgi:hypothetical protein